MFFLNKVFNKEKVIKVIKMLSKELLWNVCIM